MLSKTDIINEMGKGICIYPFIPENLKENSINLSASRFAWTMSENDIYYCEKEHDKDKRFSLIKDAEHSEKLTIRKKDKVVYSDLEGDQYIVLLPFSTTVIETREVLSVKGYIGGTYHSKVGLVSKGIGHIGTMLGPNFSGHSLVAVHNISNELIVLKVGETFVSVIFYYLKTSYPKLNPTNSGHTDKFSELGIDLSDEDSNELNQDWKRVYEEVRKKLSESETYKQLMQDKRAELRHKYLKFINIHNLIVLSLVLGLLFVFFFIAKYLDGIEGGTTWTDRYINVGFSGVFIVIISSAFNHLKNKM